MSHLSPYLCPVFVDCPILPHPIMSTTSTVTTSVVQDSTPGNEHEITNCICILVDTCGNGTLFSPYSFQEDDLVNLCMGLG